MASVLKEFRGHHTQLFADLGAFCYDQAMARLARVVIPGMPHHITQRGNRRQ